MHITINIHIDEKTGKATAEAITSEDGKQLELDLQRITQPPKEEKTKRTDGRRSHVRIYPIPEETEKRFWNIQRTLRAEMAHRGLEVGDVARRTGISAAQIRNYIGDRPMGIWPNNLKKLSGGLGVTIERLIGEGE